MSVFKARVAILAQGRPSKLCHSMFSLLLYKLALRHDPPPLYVHISSFPLFVHYFILNNACSTLTSNEEYRHVHKQVCVIYCNLISLQSCMHARYVSCQHGHYVLGVRCT